MAREKLGLLSQPAATVALFCKAASNFLLTQGLSLATTRYMLFIAYPLAAGYAAMRFFLPELFAEPACGTMDAGGALYLPSLLL